MNMQFSQARYKFYGVASMQGSPHPESMSHIIEIITILNNVGFSNSLPHAFEDSNLSNSVKSNGLFTLAVSGTRKNGLYGFMYNLSHCTWTGTVKNGLHIHFSGPETFRLCVNCFEVFCAGPRHSQCERLLHNIDIDPSPDHGHSQCDYTITPRSVQIDTYWYFMFSHLIFRKKFRRWANVITKMLWATTHHLW